MVAKFLALGAAAALVNGLPPPKRSEPAQEVLAGASLAGTKIKNKLSHGRSAPFDFNAHNADIERIRSKFGNKSNAQTKTGSSKAAGSDKGSVEQLQFPSAGTWLAKVSVGEPGQEFLVVIDTGSADFWVDGQAGKGISGIAYDPSKSSKSNDTGRPFNDWYGDGSQGITGDLYTDTVSLGGLNASGQLFGRGSNIVGGVSNGIDGILGLAFQEMSTFNAPNVFQTIVDQGKSKNIFGASMGNNGSAEFTFGHLNHEKYSGDITYHKLHSADYWNVEMSLGFNSNKSTQSFRGALDTGTTVVYVSPQVAADLYSALGGEELPWYQTGGYEGYYKVPCNLTGDISFFIDRAVYNMPIDDNFFGGTIGDDCIGNIIGEGIGDASKIDAVVGDLFLTQFYSAYDGENKTIGLASAAPGTTVTHLLQ